MHRAANTYTNTNQLLEHSLSHQLLNKRKRKHKFQNYRGLNIKKIIKCPQTSEGPKWVGCQAEFHWNNDLAKGAAAARQVLGLRTLCALLSMRGTGNDAKRTQCEDAVCVFQLDPRRSAPLCTGVICTFARFSSISGVWNSVASVAVKAALLSRSVSPSSRPPPLTSL